VIHRSKLQVQLMKVFAYLMCKQVKQALTYYFRSKEISVSEKQFVMLRLLLECKVNVRKLPSIFVLEMLLC